MDSETSSSASCRIVVVSSSIDTSREVAHRIKTLSGDTSSETPPFSEVIHWTIRNKYYTAPVHFHPIHIDGLEFIELDDVPAVIYAWKGNESYRTHMKQVFEQTSSFNPEVSLAISMTLTTDEELEDFFFEHGFEYVEGYLDKSVEEGEDSVGLSGSSSSTPGMRRAVDALSTIMWPSMVRTTPGSNKSGTKSKSANGPLLDELDELDAVDVDYRTLVEAADADTRSNMQREMEMLERWLEEEDDKQLRLRSRSPTKRNTTSIEHDPWLPIAPGPQTEIDPAFGFDDDFTEFVSVPVAGATSSSHPPEGLGRGNEEDGDSDSELPSEADIRAASAQIFGASRAPTHSDLGEYASLSDTDDNHHKREDDAFTEAESRNKTKLDMDPESFDLTRIVGTLNEMRDEIGRIPDIKARRRAAARAALGIVYGMDMDETNEGIEELEA